MTGPGPANIGTTATPSLEDTAATLDSSTGLPRGGEGGNFRAARLINGVAP